jgi:hypothetical protein
MAVRNTRTRSKAFLLGTLILAGYGQQTPSAEAIGDFKLQTGAVSAQYNGRQTAIANFNIKSGTNDLHGSAFLYMNNEALDAADLSTRTQELLKSPADSNSPGLPTLAVYR